MLRTDIEIEIRKWLVTRFDGSWWTPNFDRMTNAMIAHNNIVNVDDVKRAAEKGTLEEVISLHLKKMSVLMKKSKRHVRLDDVCED